MADFVEVKTDSWQNYGGKTKDTQTGGSSTRRVVDNGQSHTELVDPFQTIRKTIVGRKRTVQTDEQGQQTVSSRTTEQERKIRSTKSTNEQTARDRQYVVDGFAFMLEIPFESKEPRDVDNSSSHRLSCPT